jgi:hypothetical protein
MGPSRAALLFDQRAGAAHLKGALDLVERVAVVAHDLAGLREVSEFFGELQQRELSFGTLGHGGHFDPPGRWLTEHFQSTPADRMTAFVTSGVTKAALSENYERLSAVAPLAQPLASSSILESGGVRLCVLAGGSLPSLPTKDAG